MEKFLCGNQEENLSFLFEEKDLRTAKQMFEKLFIERKLREYEGDVKKVAQEIGIDLSSLYREIKSYGIGI